MSSPRRVGLLLALLGVDLGVFGQDCSGFSVEASSPGCADGFHNLSGFSGRGFIQWSAMTFVVNRSVSDSDASSGDELVQPAEADTDAEEEAEAEALAGTEDFESAPPEDDVGIELKGACWLAEGEGNPVGVHITATCPSDCPYSQRLSGRTCWKACVKAHECNKLHAARTFADPLTLQCVEGCSRDPQKQVAGCHVCASEGVCRECTVLHSPSADGKKCVNDLRKWWAALYFIGLTMVVLMLAYFLHLYCKKTTADHLLAGALRHRERCLPQESLVEVDGRVVWKPRSWFGSRVCEQDICGVGVALYFRWLRFMVIFSLFLFVAYGLAWHGADTFTILAGMETVVQQVDLADGCSIDGLEEMVRDLNGTTRGNISAQNGSDLALLLINVKHKSSLGYGTAWRPRITARGRVRHLGGKRTSGKHLSTHEGEGGEFEEIIPAGSSSMFPMRATWLSLAAYIMATFASLEFSRRQLRFARNWGQEQGLHHRYAIQVAGLPPDYIDPDALKMEFQRLLDAQAQEGQPQGVVVGTSVAFEASDPSVSSSIELAVDKMIQEQEYACYSRMRHGDTPQSDSSAELVPDSDAQPAPDGTRPEEATKSRGFSWSMSSLWHHGIMGTIDELVLRSSRREDKSTEEVIDDLRSMKGTGTAIIVFSSQSAVSQLLELPAPRLGDGEGFPVTLRKFKTEPSQVMWRNFQSRAGWFRYIRGVTVFFLGMIGFVVLYIPYAAHYALVVTTEQAEVDIFCPWQAFIQDSFLGVLIAAGNAVVAITIFYVSRTIGFVSKTKHELLVQGLVVLGTAVNTTCDLALIIAIATGAFAKDVLYGERYQTGYGRRVSFEIMHLLVPGYLLLPYLLAPVVESLLPTYVNSNLVRSSKGLTQREAEVCLELPGYEVSWRYADLLHMLSLCMALLFFSSANSYRIFLILAGCLMLIYCLDRYRLLRQAALTLHPSESLSAGFSYWLAVPTGLLGTSALWWAAQADMVYLWPPLAFLAVMPIHVLGYSVALYFIRHVTQCSVEQSQTPYSEMHDLDRHGAACNYFNTNWAQTCRLRFAHEEGTAPSPTSLDTRSMVPYVSGKAHLFRALAEVSSDCPADGAKIPAPLANAKARGTTANKKRPGS